MQINAGDDEAAVKLWEQARTNNPDAVDPRVFLARHFRANNDLEKAEALAAEAYSLAPYLPAAQFEFALLKLNSNKFKDALPAIESLVDRFPASVQPLELLARAHEKAGNLDALESTLVTMVERFPQHRKSAVALARLQTSQQEFDEALVLAKDLRAKDPGSADSYAVEGEVLYAKAAYKEAAAAFAKAHELNPNSESVLKLDAARRRAGMEAELLESWLNENPEDVPVRLAVATHRIADGLQNDAVNNYEKILQIQPKNTIALNNLAWIYEERGDKRALEYAKRAYDLAPARAEIADTYGWILFRAGQQEQALSILIKAVDRDPVNQDIRFHLASALAETGTEAKALEHLDTILANEAGFQSRADAEKLLKTLRP
jgi:putative PEP-CTERM system TPR-repeat lipoprotein